MTNDSKGKPGNKKHQGNHGKPGPRRNGRILAFQILYGLGFETENEDAIKTALVENPAVLHEKNKKAVEFARDLVLGVARRRDDLDQSISESSQHWKIERIARIELNILRLALFEMTFTGTPVKVVINEAVEMAKQFGDGRSSKFINGILDNAAKRISSGK